MYTKKFLLKSAKTGTRLDRDLFLDSLRRNIQKLLYTYFFDINDPITWDRASKECQKALFAFKRLRLIRDYEVSCSGEDKFIWADIRVKTLDSSEWITTRVQFPETSTTISLDSLMSVP